MTGIAELQKVSKRYRPKPKSLREMVRGLVFEMPTESLAWALQNVSLNVARGELLGIIGSNGAGKSTVLKLFARVTKPTSGTVTVRGKVGALIELSAGLYPELTGKENIFLYGSIVGMSRKEIRHRFDAIVEFSGLQQVLHLPVRTYSSGMVARLSFSISVHTDPDLFLVDEVLAVGDEAFQRQCIRRMQELQHQGKAIVFVSHNLALVKSLTTHCLWLRQGAVEMTGSPVDVVSAYLNAERHDRDEQTLPRAVRLEAHRDGRGLSITEVGLGNEQNEPSVVFDPQNLLRLHIDFRAQRPFDQVVFGAAIFKDHVYLFGSKHLLTISPAQTGSEQRLILTLPHPPFLRGDYTVTVGACERDQWQAPIDFHAHVLRFRVKDAPATALYDGWITTEHAWEHHQSSTGHS